MDDKILEFEKNFSVLDRYGTDVTKDEYVTNPAIGRDKQIKELILILLTPEKSAILIGKPGIGKTAIVEGLAYRIQQNDVPDALKGYTIINIKTASLLGTMPSGESKVQKMIDELKTKEKVILFIDEVHMLIGATDSSSLDFANIFKEGLGRGSIKVIGATTTEEYERYILRDKAFTRRFQKVEVPEPSFDETVLIMMGTLPKFEKQTGVKMKYSPFIQKRIMTFIVDITSEYKRVYALGSRYPDVSLTLLKQAFSYAVYDSREFMDIFDIRKAIEDSKNIYPDVKKKELPRFDKEFEDIILEEKGEKEIEPWRLDKAQYQKEEETQVEDDPEKIVETYDQMIEEQKKNQEVIGVVQRKKEEDVPRKKFKNDAKNIDDLLLTGDIGVLQDDKYGVSVPNIKVKINKELKKNQIDDVLLSGGIGSILDSNETVEEIQTYKTDQKVNEQLLSEKSKNIILKEKVKKAQKVDLYEDDEPKKEEKEQPKKLNTMVVNRETPKRPMDIDISKYLNRFGGETTDGNKEVTQESQDESDGTGGTPIETNKPVEKVETEEDKKESVEEKKKDNSYDSDLIKEISKYLNDNVTKITKSKEDREKKKDKGDESMYGQNYGGNIDFLMGGNGNGGYQPNNGNDAYNPGMGMPNQQPPQNNMDFLMGGNNNMPPYGQNNFGPAQQGMMNPNQGYQAPPANQFMPQPQMPQQEEPKRETLFGVPMYDESKEKEIEGSAYGQMNNQVPNQPMGMNDPFNTPNNENFFGAPMYSNDTPSEGVYSKDNDIFGQLLLPENNMRIQGGRITDDFSDLKMPPSSGKMIIGDVMDNVPPQNNFGGNAPMMAPPQNNYGPQMDPGYGPQGPAYGPQMDPGYGPQGYGPQMDPGYGQPMPYGGNSTPLMPPPQGNFVPQMDPGYGPQGPAYGPQMDPGYGPQMDPGYGPQGFAPQGYGPQMDPGYGQPMPNYGQPQQFGPPNQGYGMPNQMNNGVPYAPYAVPRGPVFNELKVEENNLLKKPSEIEKEKQLEEEEERKAREELEKAKSEEEFVNYSDLKSGKVDQSDLEKYVSQKDEDKESEDEKPVPRVDLNLETGAGDEDDYLD